MTKILPPKSINSHLAYVKFMRRIMFCQASFSGEFHGLRWCFSFLLMHFCSTKAAKQAVENMKAVRDDLTVKSEEGAAYASKELVYQMAS